MARASRTMHAEASAWAATSIALVANAQSGSSDPDDCRERLRALGADTELFPIEDAERAVKAGADRVVVAGGDGSIASVAAAAGAAGVPLAVIPAGTANDFARRLGLPSERAAACRLAARGNALRPLELGWMEAPAGGRRRPFVNVASVGLPAGAARIASSAKRTLGALGYAVGAFVAGAQTDPLGCRVEGDGRELHAGDVWQVTVAASGAFGGGAQVELADPADGELDVVAVPAGARLGLAGLAYRLRRGTVSRHRRAACARCASALVVVAADTDWNVDGEVVPFGPARFSARQAAFRLVVG